MVRMCEGGRVSSTSMSEVLGASAWHGPPQQEGRIAIPRSSKTMLITVSGQYQDRVRDAISSSSL